MPLVDRQAEFAAYVAAAQVKARLVGDSLDPVPMEDVTEDDLKG